MASPMGPSGRPIHQRDSSVNPLLAELYLSPPCNHQQPRHSPSSLPVTAPTPFWLKPTLLWGCQKLQPVPEIPEIHPFMSAIDGPHASAGVCAFLSHNMRTSASSLTVAASRNCFPAQPQGLANRNNNIITWHHWWRQHNQSIIIIKHLRLISMSQVSRCGGRLIIDRSRTFPGPRTHSWASVASPLSGSGFRFLWFESCV